MLCFHGKEGFKSCDRVGDSVRHGAKLTLVLGFNYGRANIFGEVRVNPKCIGLIRYYMHN